MSIERLVAVSRTVLESIIILLLSADKDYDWKLGCVVHPHLWNITSGLFSRNPFNELKVFLTKMKSSLFIESLALKLEEKYNSY